LKGGNLVATGDFNRLKLWPCPRTIRHAVPHPERTIPDLAAVYASPGAP